VCLFKQLVFSVLSLLVRWQEEHLACKSSASEKLDNGNQSAHYTGMPSVTCRNCRTCPGHMMWIISTWNQQC